MFYFYFTFSDLGMFYFCYKLFFTLFIISILTLIRFISIILFLISVLIISILIVFRFYFKYVLFLLYIIFHLTHHFYPNIFDLGMFYFCYKLFVTLFKISILTLICFISIIHSLLPFSLFLF